MWQAVLTCDSRDAEWPRQLAEESTKDPIAREPSAASAQLKKLLVFSEKLLVSWTRKEPGSKLARRLGG